MATTAARRRQSATRIPDIDPKSAAGLALTEAVQSKLRQFLGADYTDRSLAQYVVVMLAHKTEQAALGDNMVEFLGEVDAREAASWIFEHLHTLVAPEPAPQQAQQHQGQQQQPQQQRQQQQQQQQQQQAVATADEGDTLELELGGSEGEGGSDADTADVAMAGGHGGGHGDGPGGRRLLSAVVKDEYRRHDSSGRRGRVS